MNYIGSKLSLIHFIQDAINEVTGITDGTGYIMADLFAGTGIVGSTFKKQGFSIISNDIQYYSYIMNKHLIENSTDINTSKLKYLNSLTGVEGFIYKNYCMGSGSNRNYFSDYNGKKCDIIRQEIDRMYNNKEIFDKEYYCFLASLINSIDKYANTASVYGAFLKNLKKSASKEFELDLLPVIYGNNVCKVYNEDVNILIKKISGHILYLDPPYNTRQYCTNYHVLETISKYDNPSLNGVTGLREYSMQKSAYCSKKTAKHALENLIANAKFKYIFLSYNNEGIIPVDNIKKIMEKYGEYKVYTKNYRRFKSDRQSNRNHKLNSTIEYLHCLIK